MKYFFFCVLSLFLFSCAGDPAERAVDTIKQLEKSKNFQKSDSLINSYVRFSDANPGHKLAPVFLFKAAQLCVKSNKVVKSARLYERMATEYPSDTLAPEAMIRSGIAYATVPDPANAKRMYDKFIAAFPTHARIAEVRMWSETAGMTEEELLRRFEARFSETDSTTEHTK